MYKNYCLNKDVHVTLINKGLDMEDKKCILQIASSNVGDGTIFCENRDKHLKDFDGKIYNNVDLTKLSRYIKFLTENNLAVVKIDVEGAEGNVIEGGKELITKYHIPFLVVEFAVQMIEAHGTNALKFLQFFENNGYTISLVDFFSKEYNTSSELIKSKINLNLYMTYKKILE